MKRIYIIFIVLLTLSVSCTKNFEDFNTDEKNPTVVDGEFLFSNAQKELVDQISSTNVNLNIWKLVSQYWTETTYTDEANYDVVNRTIPDNIFDVYYRLVLKPLNESKTLISTRDLFAGETEAQRSNKLLIIDLMEVYTYHNLVNIFGDVPYTDALDVENISPVYDDALTIYKDLITRINADFTGLDASNGSFGSADLIYGGDVAAWKLFANSLKLKIAINLADVDFNYSKTNVEAAVTDGVFTSGADNALFNYQGSTPNTNPLYEDLILSGRKDFVLTNTLVDKLNDLKDPRLNYYLQGTIDFKYLYTNPDGSKKDTTITDVSRWLFYADSTVYKEVPFTIYADDSLNLPSTYLGGDYGYSSAYSSFSHIHDNIQVASFPGILLTYSEIEFYIAEAAARTMSVGQGAQEAYDNAVTASVLYWGGTASEATDYLTGKGDYLLFGTWQEAIGTQAWISFYTRGLVAYNEYRRLDFPVMNEAPDAATGGPVPTRFTYPINEQTLNAVNYAAAAAAIGGDDLLTKLFWDIN